eukprot:1140275-Rhodomonas_salina.1
MAEKRNQDASCKGLHSKTCNALCKGLIFKTCNAPRPATLHQFRRTCNSSNLLLSASSILNVLQQQPSKSTFQCFINFERVTEATFYFPTLHQFR